MTKPTHGAARPASLRLKSRPVSITGHLVASTTDHACLRLPPGSAEGGHLAVGEPAELFSLDRGRLVGAHVAVADVRSGVVVLRFVRRTRGMERRRQQRVTLDRPVVMRTVAAQGACGAWVFGRTLDLSTGGLSLRCPVGLIDPTHVEVRLTLQDDDASSRAARVAAEGARVPASTMARETIRAACRVVAVRRIAGGLADLRLSFRSLPDADLLALAAALAAPSQVAPAAAALAGG